MIVGVKFKNKFHSIWSKFLKINFRGINYGRLLALDIGVFCHFDNEKFKRGQGFTSTGNVTRLIKSLVFKQTNFPYFITEGKQDFDAPTILFFHEEDGRNDYKNQGEFVLDQLKDLPVRQMKVKTGKLLLVRSTFSLYSLLNKLILLVKAIVIINPFRQHFEYYNSEKVFHLLSRCLVFYDFSEHLKKSAQIWKDIKLLITFSDMKHYSNLLTQIARLKQIRSATLQHGIYSKLPDDSYALSAINYLNFTSDYLLAWGESLKTAWRETPVRSDQIIVAGCNVKNTTTEVIYTGQQLPEQLCFGVLMGAEHRRVSNENLLKTVQEVSDKTGIGYEILFHPTNNIEHYFASLQLSPTAHFKHPPSIVEFIKSKSFLICHSTTLYYTCLMHMRKCFRFNDEVFHDMGGFNDDLFRNSDELIDMIRSKSYLMSVSDVEKINNLLAYHFGPKKGAYKRVVTQLMNDTANKPVLDEVNLRF